MTKVLKADGSAAAAHVFKAFAGADEFFLEFRLTFEAPSLAFWVSDLSGDFYEPRTVSDEDFHAGLYVDGGGPGPPEEWVTWGQRPSNGTIIAPTAGAWHVVSAHFKRVPGSGNEGYVKIDGVAISDNTGAPAGMDSGWDGLWLGQRFPSVGASVAFFDYVKVGTTLGGADIFSDDFESGTLAAWDSTSGAVSVVDDPLAPPPDTLLGRVLIALDDPALEPSPTWTRIDDTPNLVSGIDIHRGRQTEFDLTEASTATVFLHDAQGLFDHNNPDSPYFGRLDGKQITLQLWNPVAAAWVPQWRGFIDDITSDFVELAPLEEGGTRGLSNVQIECVDAFDYLAGVEMIPGQFGQPPPGGSEGVVFYEDGDWQTRIVDLLTDAAFPADLTRVFTGNVDVQETKYDPGDSIMIALRDACDAEFPGIANIYVDKLGRVCAHGRFARFDPDGVKIGTDWDFTRWKAGDGAAILLDADRAQIRPPLQWARPRSRIINAAISYPRGMLETAMAGQITIDSTSRDAYGYRSWSAPDLIVQSGTTTGNNAKDECKLFGLYYVENYKDPRTRVEALSFKSLRPADDRAAKTWALICGADISDVVNLAHGYPGGVGLDGEDFYVEGSEMQIRPGPPIEQGGFDIVELTLNVSPAAYYTDDVFSGG